MAARAVGAAFFAVFKRGRSIATEEGSNPIILLRGLQHLNQIGQERVRRLWLVPFFRVVVARQL